MFKKSTESLEQNPRVHTCAVNGYLNLSKIILTLF